MKLLAISEDRGVTLVESLLVIAILLTLLTGVGGVYTAYSLSVQLNDAEDTMVQYVRFAKERSKGRVNSTSHGIKISPHELTLFQGADYASRNTGYDRIFTPPAAIQLSSSFTSDELLFTPGTNQPVATGTITITHEVSGIRSIGINEWGVIQTE